MTQVKV